MYLRARPLLRQFRRKNFLQAKEMFARAASIDPEFGLAYAGLANCCSYLYLCWEATKENLDTSDWASPKAVSIEKSLHDDEEFLKLTK